jgi:hypothetical protein
VPAGVWDWGELWGGLNSTVRSPRTLLRPSSPSMWKLWRQSAGTQRGCTASHPDPLISYSRHCRSEHVPIGTLLCALLLPFIGIPLGLPAVCPHVHTGEHNAGSTTSKGVLLWRASVYLGHRGMNFVIFGFCLAEESIQTLMLRCSVAGRTIGGSMYLQQQLDCSGYSLESQPYMAVVMIRLT